MDSPRHSISSSVNLNENLPNVNSVTSDFGLKSLSEFKGVQGKGRFNALSHVLSTPPAAPSLIPLTNPLSLLPSTSSLGLPTLPTLPSTLPPSSLPPHQKSTLTPSTQRASAPVIQVREMPKVKREEVEAYIKDVESEGWEGWKRGVERGKEKGKERERDVIIEEEEDEEEEEGGDVDRVGEPESITQEDRELPSPSISRRPSQIPIFSPPLSPSRASSPSPSLISTSTAPTMSRRKRLLPSTSANRPLRREDLPPLSSVPTIFFSPTFNLADPETWDAVTERPTPFLAPVGSYPFPSPRGSPNVSEVGLPIIPGGAVTTPTASTGHRKSPSLSLADLATDQILQEKLSHYLTLLESHLSLEISLRSTSFFSALSSLQSLSSLSSDSLASLKELKVELEEVDREVALKGLRIGELRKGRKKMEQVQGGLREVERVVQGLGEVEGLVERGEWEGGLEGIDALEEMLKTGSDGGVDFSKIRALEGFPRKLGSLRLSLGKQVEIEIVETLSAGYREVVKDWKLALVIKDFPSSYQPSLTPASTSPGSSEKLSFVEHLSNKLGNLVQCAIKAGGVEGAIDRWKEVAEREGRERVRDLLGNLVDGESGIVGLGGLSIGLEELECLRSEEEGETDGSGTMVEQRAWMISSKLISLSHEEFVTLLRDGYESLIKTIEVFECEGKILFQTLEEIEEKRARKEREEEIEKRMRKREREAMGLGNGEVEVIVEEAEEEEQEVEKDGEKVNGDKEKGGRMTPVERSPLSAIQDLIADVIYSISESSNYRFSKILSVRSPITSSLPLPKFVQIFNLSWNFVLSCEILSSKMIVGLRGMLVNQSKSWLVKFHDGKVSQEAKRVEEEKWDACEVERKVQNVVEKILQSAVEDPDEFIIHSLEYGTSERMTNGSENGEKPKNQLEIEGRTFFAVRASLKCLEALSDYLKVVMNCNLLTTDTMGRIIEFLKAFNSRTCQVVLGAGAMRSAGLKNITAKHLALASQSLSIMIALIPYVRETLRRHLNQKQAVMLIEFDRLKRDYQEHQYEIHAKFVSILQDRLTAAITSFKTIDWENVNLQAEGKANSYMEGFIKDVMTLHKVLNRWLHPQTVDSIMAQVFNITEESLKLEMGAVELKSETVRQKLLGDVKYLRTKLGELQGLGIPTPGENLEHYVNAKPLVIPTPVPPTPRRNLSYAIRLPSTRRSAKPNPAASVTPATPPPSTPPLSAADLRASMEIGPSPSPNIPESSPKVSMDTNGTPFQSNSALVSTTDLDLAASTNGTNETPRTSEDKVIESEEKKEDIGHNEGEDSVTPVATKRESLPPPTPEKEAVQLQEEPNLVNGSNEQNGSISE